MMSWRQAATLHGVVVAMQQRSSTLQLPASVNGSVDDEQALSNCIVQASFSQYAQSLTC